MRLIRRVGTAHRVEEICRGDGSSAPTVVVCGEHFGSEQRATIGVQISGEQPNVALLFGDELCGDPRAIDAALFNRVPAAVVIVACDTASAVGPVRDAIRVATDSARCAGVSLSVGAPPAEGLRPGLLEIICAAAARRSETLASEPLAGAQRMQFRGPLSRRELLSGWRLAPRRAAGVTTSRCLGTKHCGICVAACPQGAIRVAGGEAVVDPLRCNLCNACAFACPTEAISVPGASLDALAAQLQVVLDYGLRDISFTCDSHPPPASAELAHVRSRRSVVVGVPCVASLGPGLVLGLIARRCAVRVLPSPGCDRAGELASIEQLVLRVLEAAGRAELSPLVSLTGRVEVEAAINKSRIGGSSPPEGRDRCGEPLVANEPDATSRAIRTLLEGRVRQSVIQCGVLADDAALAGIVRVHLDTCTYCGACALVCPTGAIAKGPTGSIVVDASRCVACGRCTTVCPEESVAITRGLDLFGVLAGPTELPRRLIPEGALDVPSSDDAEPMLASVLRRLATRGANEALLQTIRQQANGSAYPD